MQAHVNILWLTSDLFPSNPEIDCQLEAPTGVFAQNSHIAQSGLDSIEVPLDGTVTLAAAGSLHLECGYAIQLTVTLPVDASLVPQERSLTAIPASGVN